MTEISKKTKPIEKEIVVAETLNRSSRLLDL